MKKLLILLIVMALAGGASATEIIAFGDAGHSSTGGWAGGAEKYQAAPANGATSTMTFAGLANGTYYAYANWSELFNRTPEAQYAISDGGGVAVRNQQLANGDISADFGGTQDLWTGLGSVTVLDGSVSVTASDLDGVGEAGETLYLISHAVRLSDHQYNETAGGGMVIDDWFGPGYSTTGAWGNIATGYLNSGKYQSDPAGADTATYTFTGLDDGYYNVSTTWEALFNRTNDAVYTISDGGGAVHINQQAAPAADIVDEIDWEVLNASVMVTDGTLEIVLSDNDAAGFLITDSVRLEWMSAPEPATVILLSLGGLLLRRRR